MAAGTWAALLLVVLAAPVAAHEAGTTALDISVGEDETTIQFDLPLVELEQVLGIHISTDALGLSLDRDLIVTYVVDHLAVVSENGNEWPEVVGPLTAVRVDGSDYLRLVVALEVDATNLERSVVSYDGVLEVDDAHVIIVTLTKDRSTNVIGVIDSHTSASSLDLDQAGREAFSAMVGSGFDHVLDGADHIFFLVVLLLPAPLMVVGGRWQTADGLARARRKLVHVATAFTIGHSLTLVASSQGWLYLPTRLIEVLIAVSVGVSAAHVLRPLARQGEPIIALGFGLVHGMAFAGLLDNLALSSSSSLWSLLGFNVGIELAQLFLIAVTFPSLWVLSTTSIYSRVRVGGSSMALVISVAWIVERLEIARSPFNPIETWMVDHLGVVAGLLALVAVLARLRRFGMGLPTGTVPEPLEPERPRLIPGQISLQKPEL